MFLTEFLYEKSMWTVLYPVICTENFEFGLLTLSESIIGPALSFLSVQGFVHLCGSWDIEG